MNTPTYPPQPNQSSELGDTILVRTAFTAIDHELDAMTDEEIERLKQRQSERKAQRDLTLKKFGFMVEEDFEK
jgi:hypothetical protein